MVFVESYQNRKAEWRSRSKLEMLISSSPYLKPQKQASARLPLSRRWRVEEVWMCFAVFGGEMGRSRGIIRGSYWDHAGIMLGPPFLPLSPQKPLREPLDRSLGQPGTAWDSLGHSQELRHVPRYIHTLVQYYMHRYIQYIRIYFICRPFVLDSVHSSASLLNWSLMTCTIP